MTHNKLSKLYQQRFPRLDIFFNEFNSFINQSTSETTTLNSHSYIWNYYRGKRRDIPYTPLLTSCDEVFVSADNEEIQCDNNKSSIYTLEEVKDYNLPCSDDLQFQNIDFLLLVIPLLLNNASKKDVLQFLFYFYLNERVEIKEGHQYLGKLDESYSLDNPRIKFRDDKKFQTFSYIVFYKSYDIDEKWLYKNVIPLSKTMGIHIELVSVNESKSIEYFDDIKTNCSKVKECEIINNNDEFDNFKNHICIDFD
jgi:hypothetical protein